MTVRQYVLKVAYPIIMFIGKIFPSKNDFLQNDKNLRPNISFYDLKAVSIDGTEIDFSSFKGKKVMIVNTASDCGYTAQYNELEKLHQQQKDKLVIIGFPANDFKEQEKKDDTAIANFCKRNYGVNFLLAKKSRVIKGINQNNVFNWLSDSVKNGWCNQQPVWNFSKYLINENGMLTYFFSNKISPLDKKVLQSLN
jgi:glutathione peroxidase